MPCSGNILFTLTGQTYVAMTSGGTLLVVACSSPGGISGWRLTATSVVTSDTYSADPASTCTPFNLIFYNVIIDCGVVNIVLSSNLAACTSSSSAVPTPSSSNSPSESSSESGTPTPTVPGETCQQAMPVDGGVTYGPFTIVNSIPAAENWFLLPAGADSVDVFVDSITPGGIVSASVYSGDCDSLVLTSFVPNFNIDTNVQTNSPDATYFQLTALNGGMGGSVTYRVRANV